MKNQKSHNSKVQVRKTYQMPTIERIALDTEIALSMVSVPPNPMMPQMPEGYVQKIFKLRW
jgi:hypothetical protein